MTQNELIKQIIKEVSFQLTKMLIVEFRKDIIKNILPRVRKTISEEIDRKIKDIVYESFLAKSNNYSLNGSIKKRITEDSDNEEEYNNTLQENTQKAKKIIATRQKAKSIADQLFSDDPLLNEMIMTAHDAEEELNRKATLREEHIANSELVSITEAEDEELANPEIIDYSEILDRIGVK